MRFETGGGTSCFLLSPILFVFEPIFFSFPNFYPLATRLDVGNDGSSVLDDSYVYLCINRA